MATRRTFLVGAGAALTLPMLRKFEWFIETHAKPLIEVPRHPVDTLYVDLDGGGQITLGPWGDGPPTITWAEYLENYLGVGKLPKRKSELRVLCEDYGVEFDFLHSECDSESYTEAWWRSGSPNAKAYYLLDSLDLGPELLGRPGEAGVLDFIDGAAPGSDYLGVHVYDDLSISLLQHRLNVLEEDIAVEVVS